MVVEPLGSSGRAVELLGVKWLGKVLSNERGGEECMVEAEDGRVTPFYTRSARVWRSVTPVILHGFNATRRVVSVGKTERLLLRSFEMAGRSQEQVESLAFQAAPFWIGGGGGEEYTGAKASGWVSAVPRGSEVSRGV